MRWSLTLLALSTFVGCGKSSDAATAPVVCSGDVTITTRAELDTFAARGCTSITGILDFHGTAVPSVNLPALTAVGALFVSDSAALTRLSLPALNKVDTDLEVYGNAALTTLDLPALETVGWSLSVHESPALTSVSLSSLTTVVGNLMVLLNPAPTSLSLPMLTEVGGELYVYRNTALTRLSLPALTTVGGDLSIIANPVLPECLVLGLKDHLVAVHGFTGPWNIHDNDTTATCP